MEYIRINHEIIKEWCAKTLLFYGAKPKDASIVANVLVEADMREIASHGVAGGSGLDDIISKIQQGGINNNYNLQFPSVEKMKYPTIINVDADGGPGHSIAMTCVEIVKNIARKYGKGIVYLSNATHFGAAGIYSEKIAEDKDIIGKVSCITPSWMSLFNKNNELVHGKYLGTNPVAWSTPYQDGVITIDAAMTQRASSVALNAGKNNISCEDKQYVTKEYLLDNDGKEIICPSGIDQVINGSLLPLGGYEYGYKGYGFALSITLEHIIGGSTYEFIPNGCKTIKGRVGQIFEATMMDSLYNTEDAISKMQHMIIKIKNLGVALPGEIEHEKRKESIKLGVKYSKTQVKRLVDIGDKTGIPFMSIKFSEVRDCHE